MKKMLALLSSWVLCASVHAQDRGAEVYLPPHHVYIPMCLLDPPVTDHVAEHPQINVATCQCHYEVFLNHPASVSFSKHLTQAATCFWDMEEDPGAFTAKYVQRSKQMHAGELLDSPAED